MIRVLIVDDDVRVARNHQELVESVPEFTVVGTAHTAAAALAVALKAEKLLVLTDVEGLYRDWPDSADVIGEISPESLAEIMPTLSTGMVPIRTITSRTSGVAATALSSTYSRSITGLGVADGAQIIVHPTASKPGTPDSAIVGTLGNAGTRPVELTPSARTLPALMWPTTLPASANISAT